MKKQNTLGELEHTLRGFEVINFKDANGAKCHLMQSSLAEYEKPGTSAIYLGLSESTPQCLHYDAESLGVRTNQKCGWVPYPIPEKVYIPTMTHLNRKQVEALIGHLQSWLDNDTFDESVKTP